LSKSLRKRKNLLQKQNPTQKVFSNHNHLHYVAGEHKHNVTHTITPISADEIERIHSVSPELVDRLFNIIESSLEAEKQETQNFYNAVEREQKNDELSILKQSENNQKAVKYSFLSMIILMICGIIAIVSGYPWIGGAIMTTVLLGVVRAILKQKEPKEEN
jgi:predicted amino acid-binding ACT domain protein